MMSYADWLVVVLVLLLGYNTADLSVYTDSRLQRTRRRFRSRKVTPLTVYAYSLRESDWWLSAALVLMFLCIIILVFDGPISNWYATRCRGMIGVGLTAIAMSALYLWANLRSHERRGNK